MGGILIWSRFALAVGATGVLAGIAASAQSYVPLAIGRVTTVGTNPFALSWPTIPGKTYELHTRDGLESPWQPTNISPFKARSTVAVSSNALTDPNVPVRFYRVWERAVPAGNTSPITSATVSELEKVLGFTFTSAQRSELQSSLTDNRTTFESIRKVRLLNSDGPPLLFDPIPIGFSPETVQKPMVWSSPKVLTVPTNRAELAFYTVQELSALLRARQITSTELTQLYLERLKKYDGVLHCVITLTEELALRQAAQADEELAAGKNRGPLHGIPYGIKDLFSVRGYRTTWGAAPFKDQVIDEDASVAKKLEEAGAVLLAKLSTGELAVDDVWFGGQTRNPWNTSQGSSGSSAGPASATAAGLVAFAIGTETWGSIVSPCTVCRVTGLRSTFGRVSRTGAMTLCWSMDKIGPICRSVEDCAIVLDAIRGSDGVDHAVIDLPFNYDSARDLTTVRVGYRTLSTAMLDRLAAIVGQKQLFKVALPSTRASAFLILQVEAAAAFDELTRFGGDAFLKSGWPALFRGGQTVPGVEYLQANRLRQKLIQSMAALMETIDVYVATDADLVAGAGSELTNLTGQPCVVIPHGSGTSLGFVGRPFEEGTILALAKAYQDATPYHTNHPPSFVR